MSQSGRRLLQQEQPFFGPEVVIDQAKLQEFLSLLGARRRCEELQEEIVAALDVGIPIEPGPLHAELHTIARRRLSKAKLAAVFGPTHAEYLESVVAPTMCHKLKIWASSVGSS
jgi:hypothetical protein